MKLNKLNLGTPLSKQQQKQIKGGTPICPVGLWADCKCVDGTDICAPGDGVSTTATLCVRYNACVNHGGLLQPKACVATCGPVQYPSNA